MEYKCYKNESVSIHEINSSKFKTIQIDIKFIEKINKDHMTYRSLLPYVLKAGTKNYQTKAKIKLRLEELYGANLFSNTSRTGDLSITTFSLNFVNDKYLNENISSLAVDFLNELIFNPLIKNDEFDKDIVEEEIRLLKDEFESIIDNKSKYAFRRLIEEMFEDENYKYSSLGIYEELDNVTPKALYEYYLEFIKNKVEIIINGENKDLAKKLINLPFSKNDDLDPIDYQTKEIIDVKKVIEVKKNRQAKLVLGYRNNILINDKLRYPFVVACAILGGYPHSKLFQNVREKNSLAYSIYSRYDAFKGVMFINAGINHENFEKTLSLISDCIKELQENIKKEEFEMTKASLINDYLEMLDSQSSLSVKAFNLAITKEKFDLNDSLEKIKNVTINDVYEAAKRIKLDTIYFLGCENDEEN